MVSLPHDVYRRRTSTPGAFLGKLGAGIVDFFAILAASGRVARAVEARRQPRATDLAVLGIDGSLPRVW